MKVMKAQKLINSLNNEIGKHKIELEKEKLEFANQIKKYKKVDLFPVKPEPKNTFFEKTGISIQILKLENDIWKQTSGLDNLTLKDLNIMGRNSSDDFIMEDVDDEFETEEEI